MEEKVLIESYCPDTKKFLKIMAIIGLVVAMLLFMSRCSNISNSLADEKETYKRHQAAGSCGKYYDAGIFTDGSAAFEFTWEEFYPCATAQLFPIVHGLIGAETIRAKELYDTFSATFDWAGHNIPSEFCWGSNVYAAALVGDVESVIEYMNNYAPGMLLHSYPLYNADIARVAMAAYTVLNAQ